MLTQVIAPSGVVLKPVRLNFAGVCIYCGARDCVSARCVAAHDLSRWEVCRDCGGAGFRFGSDEPACFCCFGLIETALPHPFDLSAVVVPAVVLRPVRLNFAQFCLWCGQQWCESPVCVDRHEKSVWVLCSVCGGSQVDGCPCAGGLMEGPSARLSQLSAESTEKPHEIGRTGVVTGVKVVCRDATGERVLLGEKR